MTGLNFSNFINSILLTICLEFLQILGDLSIRIGPRKSRVGVVGWARSWCWLVLLWLAEISSHRKVKVVEGVLVREAWLTGA